jgi:predicted enzyme related to lactoylglutathione lyase
MKPVLRSFEGFTIWSGDYKQLARWYKTELGLKIVEEVDIPEDKAIAFEIDPANEMYLWIGYHSKVKGVNKDPYRQMISFFVDDVFGVYKQLVEKDVKVIAKPHPSPTGELNVLTIMDPEDNLIQLFSNVPS